MSAVLRRSALLSLFATSSAYNLAMPARGLQRRGFASMSDADFDGTKPGTVFSACDTRILSTFPTV